MATDLLTLVQEGDPELEQAWRDAYFAWTFPRTIADGQCWVAGYALQPADADSEALNETIDQICVGVIVRGPTARYGGNEVTVLTESGEQTVTLATLAAAFDAVKVAEVGDGH